MGLLRSWLSQMATDPEEGLRQLKLKAEIEKLKEEALLRKKPLWGETVYDPAAGGDFPPEVLRREGMLGPTYGEAGARADIEGKSPLKSIIAQRGSAQFMAPWMQRLYGPAGMEAISGQLYTTEPGRRWEDFLRLFGAAQKLEQAKAEKMPFPEEEVKAGEEIPSESFTYTPGAKDLVNQLEIMMGLKEKEKQPTYGTVSAGAGIYEKTGPEAGEMKGVPIPKTEAEKAKTDFRFFVDEYRKEHPEAKIGEILKAWKAKETEGKGEEAERKRGQKELDTIRQDYFNEIHQYNMAKRGVGQYIADPNKEQVAQESLERARRLADQYVRKGGDIQDLGEEKPQMGDVLPEGLTEEMIKFYVDQHGMSPQEVIQRYMMKISETRK